MNAATAIRRHANPHLHACSKLPLQLVSRQLAIAENLGQKSAANRFGPVNRHYSTAAIGMAQEVVTALGPNKIKTKASQRLDELNAVNCGEGAHFTRPGAGHR